MLRGPVWVYPAVNSVQSFPGPKAMPGQHGAAGAVMAFHHVAKSCGSSARLLLAREVRLGHEGAAKSVTGKHSRCGCEARTGRARREWQGDRLGREVLSHLRKAAGGAWSTCLSGRQVEVPGHSRRGRKARQSLASWLSGSPGDRLRKLLFFELGGRALWEGTTPDG